MLYDLPKEYRCYIYCSTAAAAVVVVGPPGRCHYGTATRLFLVRVHTRPFSFFLLILRTMLLSFGANVTRMQHNEVDRLSLCLETTGVATAVPEVHVLEFFLPCGNSRVGGESIYS